MIVSFISRDEYVIVILSIPLKSKNNTSKRTEKISIEKTVNTRTRGKACLLQQANKQIVFELE